MLFPKFAAVFAAFAVAGASAQKCNCPSNPCATNLVINGDFDDPLSGKPWTFNRMETTTIKPRSSPQAAVAKLVGADLVHSISQSVTLVPAKKYALRYYYTVSSGAIDPTAGCQILASLDTTNQDPNPLIAAPQGYAQHEFIFTAGAASQLQITIQCSEPTTVSIQLDDISIYPYNCLLEE